MLNATPEIPRAACAASFTFTVRAMFSAQWQTKTPILAIALSPGDQLRATGRLAFGDPVNRLEDLRRLVDLPARVADKQDLAPVDRAPLDLAHHLAVVQLGDDEALDGARERAHALLGERPRGLEPEEADAHALLAGELDRAARDARRDAVGEHDDVGT